MPTPQWLGATPSSPGLAGHVNQFLGSHAASFVSLGASIANQTTFGSGSTNSNSLWMAQKVTTGAGTTSFGRVVIWLGYVGQPAPLTVSLYADNGGPTGSPLASTQVPKEFLTGSGSSISVPLPATVSPSTVYWVVAQADGDATDYFFWSKSNQTSGASTSPDGQTWTAQTYGFYFHAWDGSVTTGGINNIWEDFGARWSVYLYTSGLLTGIQEFTAGQTPQGYTVSTRTLTYSSSTLTGVT